MTETQNQKEQQEPIVQSAGPLVEIAPQVNSYDEIEKQYKTKQQELNQNVNDLTKKQDEERKKEAKKQRTRQIINSVADGVSAIANLVGTAHGAPNMYSGDNLLTAKSAERYDKYYTNAEARRNAYLQAMKTKGNEELSNWYTMQKDKLKADLEERKQRVNEAKGIRLKLTSDANLVLLSHKADEKKAQALIAAAQAGNIDEYIRLKNELMESQIAENYGDANGNKDYTITETKPIPVRNERGQITGYQEIEVKKTKKHGKTSNGNPSKKDKTMPGVE